MNNTTTPIHNILAAQIIKTIGLQGEIKIKLYLSNLPVPKLNKNLMLLPNSSHKTIQIEDNFYLIKKFRPIKPGFAAIKLSLWQNNTINNLDHINLILPLINKKIYITRKALEELNEKINEEEKNNMEELEENKIHHHKSEHGLNYSQPLQPQEEYFYLDLQNCEVFCLNKALGQVTCIQDYGAGTLLQIDNKYLVLFNNQFVEKVDLKNKNIFLYPQAQLFFK